MKLVNSILDTDLYLFSMSWAYMKLYPEAEKKIRVILDGVRVPQTLKTVENLPENADFSLESSVTIEIKPDRKYLFNVGSIGQPRNHDPRSSFVIYDTDACKVTRYCLPYDIISAQEKILKAGLPKRLAERLVTGS